MAAGATSRVRPTKEAGIGYWMARVLAERAKVEKNFAADPVHDFRVALRRCRSMAEAMREVDPDPAWKKMRAAGKTVFSAFGDLRDVQVLLEWLQRLRSECPDVADQLAVHLGARELDLKASAAVALGTFHQPSWLRWADHLQQRAARFRPGAPLFEVLALQRWEAARQLHAAALRNRSKIGFHRLRIGIKRFRYLVENFLPAQHEMWNAGLKRLQDLLGEVHDLDVLWTMSCELSVFANGGQRAAWHAAIERARAQRLAEYRDLMLGRNALWQQWRAGLISGVELQRAIVQRFATWASAIGVNRTHARATTASSLALYDALERSKMLAITAFDGVAARDLLAIAADAHEVGKKKAQRGYEKRTQRMLQRLSAPPGWTETHMRVLGLLARFHRGPLPSESNRAYKGLNRKARRVVDELAAILRVAEGLACLHARQSGHLLVTKEADALVIRAQGYRPRTKAAVKLASARHLLETIIGTPVLFYSRS